MTSSAGSSKRHPARLGDWFGRGMRIAPGGAALRIGEDSWTYAQLAEHARRFAEALSPDPAAEAGAAGDPGGAPVVGVLAARSIECYAGILGAFIAGSVVVPLSPVFPPQRTAAMAQAAGVSVIIADKQGERAARTLTESLPGLSVLGPGWSGPSRRGREVTRVPPPAWPEDTAYVLFTSGSTGMPKGVPITHANMAHFLAFNIGRYGLTPADVCSQTFDVTFDLAMFDMFVTWGSGATLVSTPAHVFRSLPDFVREQGMTLWFSVPSAISLLRRRGHLTAGAMPSLRWSLFCGEPLLAADAQDWQAAAPASVVENLYGPTELTIACSVYRWSSQRSPGECVNGVVPIGEVYPGLSHLLTDAEGAPVGGLGEGELCVRGPQMFSGYLDPRHDELRFVQAQGERWYRTGDRVRRVPAGLAFTGRVDHQIKIRGYRVELAELEWHIRNVAGVQAAAVVVADDGVSPRLAAWYAGGVGLGDAIRRHLTGQVPEFMVPHWIWQLDDFPYNSNGKINRNALAAMARVAARGATVAG